MVTLGDLEKIPREYRGAAWILLQRFPEITLGDLRHRAKLRTQMSDREKYVVCENDHDATLANAVQPCIELEQRSLRFADVTPLVDILVAELGRNVCECLADGHTQSETARILGKPQQNINREVNRVRKLIEPRNFMV